MSIKDMPTPEELTKKTVLELKSYAKKNDIDIFGANTKSEILEVILSFYPREEEPKEIELENVENTAPSSTETTKPEKTKVPKNKVVVFSAKNIHWQEVGSLTKGFNIVTKEAASKWLTRGAVRSASPEELARHYGK